MISPPFNLPSAQNDEFNPPPASSAPTHPPLQRDDSFSRLRQEQDAEFQQALAADRAREQQKRDQEEAELRRQEESAKRHKESNENESESSSQEAGASQDQEVQHAHPAEDGGQMTRAMMEARFADWNCPLCGNLNKVMDLSPVQKCKGKIDGAGCEGVRPPLENFREAEEN